MKSADLISSDNKREGEIKVIESLPTFLKNRRPSYNELRILHRLSTHGAEVNNTDAVRLEKLGLLLLDEQMAKDQIMAYARAEHGKGRDVDEITREIIERGETEGFFGVKFKINNQIRGHIRKAGIALNPDGSTSIKYLPNINEIPPYGMMLGLDRNVELLLSKLCHKYDQLVVSAKNPLDFVRALMFFQVIGAGFIHPFSDGNGRAFEAHLVLELNRKGITVDGAFRIDGEGSSLCSLLIPDAAKVLLQESRLPTNLTNGMLDQILLNDKERNEYMKRLEQGISKMIDDGLIESAKLTPILNAGAYALVKALKESGYIR